MLGVVLGIAMVLIVLERTTGWKIFRFVPGMVMMYLLMATLSSLGVFGEEDSTREPIAAVKDDAEHEQAILDQRGSFTEGRPPGVSKVRRRKKSEAHRTCRSCGVGTTHPPE